MQADTKSGSEWKKLGKKGNGKKRRETKLKHPAGKGVGEAPRGQHSLIVGASADTGERLGKENERSGPHDTNGVQWRCKTKERKVRVMGEGGE